MSDYWFRQRYDAAVFNKISGMLVPVRCTKCGHIYDLGSVTVTDNYVEYSVWRCPGCRVTVDDRHLGWGNHHYVELDANGFDQ
jgi:hypothetical protein